jgi:pimeloyl-ACP methyl ester carboxylesterase
MLPVVAADPAAGRDALASSLEHPEAISDADIAARLAPLGEPERAAAIEAMVASMDAEVLVGIRAELGRLQVPTLMVWGTADDFFDVSWARWLERTIPGAVGVRLVEGGKLYHPLERPAELNAALREFWAG